MENNQIIPKDGQRKVQINAINNNNITRFLRHFRIVTMFSGVKFIYLLILYVFYYNHRGKKIDKNMFLYKLK